MVELPLFPLNLVLFPSMPLRLHIFEERYKEMINKCVDEQAPFGVVLLEEGKAEGGGIAKPRLVGTTAHITEVQRLPRGRMNILAIGRDRFRISNLDFQRHSYLTGDVEIVSLDEHEPAHILSNGTRLLRPLLGRYLEALSKAGQEDFDVTQLPDEPMEIAYLAGILLQTNNEAKQDILEIDDAKTLFTRLLNIYQREVSLIDILLSPPSADEDHDLPFSLN
ncbi:MAG: LON peptidase substrate-binding domain-containing protein [Chloroflexota bacterium]